MVQAAVAIRFALGARFQPPEPVPWSGSVDSAGDFDPACPPAAGRGVHGVDQPKDEDCRTLDVWTPGCDDGARP